MSELTGAMSLEEPEPTQETPDPPAQAAPETPPAQNADDPDPEGTVVNPTGEKLVPLSALVAERQAKSALKQEIAALKPKAEQVDRVVQEWQSVQPLIQRAQQQAQQPPLPPPPAPKGPLSDQEAMDYAKDLDLYKPDGSPDTDRAQRLASRQQSIAERQAQTLVAPLMEQNASQRSLVLKEHLKQLKDGRGQTVDPKHLDQMFNVVPAHLSAQDNVAQILYLAAKGLQAHQSGFQPAQAPPPPVQHTESVGAPAAPAASLNAVDHAFRTAADMSEKTFAATASKYQPGRVNSLE